MVLGGTGKTGRRVAERLSTMGRPIRIGSRSAATPFDWYRSETWDAALRGTSAVYVTFQPDICVPGALEIVGSFFERAIRAGATKIVLLSGRGEVEAVEAEKALQATAADWTIVRSSWFAQNFSENFLLELVLSGEFALPGGLAAEPFVDVDDLAEIACAAFTDRRHSHRIYEATGPRALTFEEAAGQIAAAAGRRIAYVPIPAQAFRSVLVQSGLSPEEVHLIMYLFTTVLDGRNTKVIDGVEQALGRPPRSFEDYVRRTAATGVWGNPRDPVSRLEA